MSIEKSLISRAEPRMLAAKARAIIRNEACKGCLPDISLEPVALEPLYEPMRNVKKFLAGRQHSVWTYEAPPQEQDLVRLQIFISQEQKFDWIRSELFLKQLQSIEHRACLEVVGNEEEITISILCHRYDVPVVSAAFRGQFDQCEIDFQKKSLLSERSGGNWDDAVFYDYFTPPPYSHLLTRPEELHVSPYEPLMTAMADIPAPAVGIYQVVFQPVDPDHNWKRNVEKLQDLEYRGKQHEDIQHPQRYSQPPPSGSMHYMSLDLETKAHNDKPFFAMALRMGVVGAGEDAQDHLRCLGTVSNFFLHGGRLLDYINEADYRSFLSGEQIRQMFEMGLTYRPGALVNSQELTGPVHIPPASIVENRQIKLKMLEPLSIRNDELQEGTPIGESTYRGDPITVHIPSVLRMRSSHYLGRSGMGKSTGLEHASLHDINNGDGVAIIDPHGDTVERLLCLLPEHCIDRTIYFDPGDPDWTLIWNPLQWIPGQDVGRVADDLVSTFKSVVSGWGDRLEHILYNALSGLIRLQKSTLFDVTNILSPKSDNDMNLRKEILKATDNVAVHKFWSKEFDGYKAADLTPPRHKIGKLFRSDMTTNMFSQPESLFNFRRIMDNQMIFLANLSNLGPEVRDLLGSFILSLFYLSALSRSDIKDREQRKDFHMYCEEAPRFVTDALEDFIAETRKYKVSLTLSNQFMSQFGKKKTDALSSVGSTIIYNVDRRDAQDLVKDLRNEVKVEDLISLEVGEAIARIGTKIVKIKTFEPLKIPEENFREKIIENSRRRYYRPAHEVREEIRRRYSGESMSTWERAPEQESQASGDPSEELHFDTF